MKKRFYIAAIALMLSIALLAGCTAPAPAAPAEPAPASEPAAAAPVEAAPEAASAAAPAQSATHISETEAKAIALADAGFKEAEVEFTKCVKDTDDGVVEYEIEFYRDGVEYDYDVDALTGKIRSSDQDKKGATPNVENNGGAAEADIGRDAAIAAALSHAGISESEAKHLHADRDRDDGRLEYEVEWRVGGIEYSCEISAADGTVISFETERDD